MQAVGTEAGDELRRQVVADGRDAAIDQAHVTVPVDERERRHVAVACRELDAERLPERGQRIGRAGRERPPRADRLRVGVQPGRRVGAWIGRDLDQPHASWQPALQLEEERGVQRARLVARGVKGRDDQVLARGRRVVERLAVLVQQPERRHGDELARELTEAEVQLVVAGVGGAGDEPSALDADEYRLDLRRGHLDVDRRDVIAEANAGVRAGRHRHGEQLALVGRRGY